MAEEAGARKRFAMLDSIKELPSLPQVLVGISKVAGDEKSRADDLANVILHDQALTMRILRIANSAQYAIYAQRVTTVSTAVILLGFQSVRAIAMGAEMYRLLSNLAKAGEVMERFWKDAIAVAVTCQELADLVGLPTPEEAFVAGLLHDVGKLIFAQTEPERTKRLYALGLGSQSLLEEERRVFGVTHVEVGAELARRWGLPVEIRTAMENHHRVYSQMPVTRGETLAFLVAVSKSLVAPMALGSEEKTRDLSAKMARLLRKPVGTVLQTLRYLPGRIQEYAEFFDIQVDDLKVYTLWVEEENQRLSQSHNRVETERREIERQQAMLSALREIHGLMLGSPGVDIVARKIAETARRTVGAKRVLIARIDPERDIVEGLFHAGDVVPEFSRRFRSALFRESILTPTVRGGEVVNVIDANVPYFQRIMTKQDLATFDAPCFVALPAVCGGRVCAVLYADRDGDDEAFSDEDVANFQSLADLTGLAFRT